MPIHHYVSQFIIKKFTDENNRIHIFDSENKKVLKNMSSYRIFCENNLFSEEIEKKLSINVESPFASLIHQKIINQNPIILTRSELKLIKKYMLVDSIKSQKPEAIHVIFKRFSPQVERYWKMHKEFKLISLFEMPSMSELNDSVEELYERILNVCIDSEDALEIALNKNTFKELYLWAKAFLDGYIAFWDSHSDQEFILTDNGMTSEYEPSYLIYEGYGVSKVPYLLTKLKGTQIKEKKAMYANLLEKTPYFPENFSIFNLSSQRSIVSINPFFRLYSKNAFALLGTGEKVNHDVPDIWPSFVETKEVFETPQNKYQSIVKYSDNDQFTYTPKVLSIYDTIYINTLFLSQIHHLIGFKSIDKVSDSLEAFIALKSVNHKDVYTSNHMINMLNLIKHVRDDVYRYIFECFEDTPIQSVYHPNNFLNQYAKMGINDTRNNLYGLKHLLNNENDVRTLPNFAFMGTPDQRIQHIKNDIENLSHEKSQSEENIDVVKKHV